MKRRGRPNKYPFDTMEVNEVYQFSRVDHHTSNIRSAASQYGKRNSKWFSVHVVNAQTGQCIRVT